jgi:DNA-binding MarR family transcriptional regulator
MFNSFARQHANKRGTRQPKSDTSTKNARHSDAFLANRLARNALVTVMQFMIAARRHGHERRRPLSATRPLQQRNAGVKREYLELTRSIERMHRRFLDVLRAELNRLGIRDINGVQALLLANIGEEQIMIRDLVERGYYQGSNVSYNIKRLSEMGYLEQERATHDRRSVSITLTPKAMTVVEKMRALEERIARRLQDEDMNGGQIADVCETLRLVERAWTDFIHYGK